MGRRVGTLGPLQRVTRTISEPTSIYERMFRGASDGLLLIETSGGELRFEAVNTAAAELFGSTRERMVGAELGDILTESARRHIEPVTREALELGEVSELTLTLEQGDEDRVARLRLQGLDSPGDGAQLFVIVQEVTELANVRRALDADRRAMRELYEVAGSPDLELAEKMRRLLEIGRRRLELPYGFITDIAGEVQRILAAVGDHEALEGGGEAPLDKTYCRKTIESNGLVTYRDAAEEGMADDPAFEEFGLACYVGAKLTVHGRVVGTVCFAASDARAREFSEGERTFVQLLAQWVGRELEREHDFRAVEQAARTDSLTGLANHGEILDRLDTEIQTARREETPLSVLLVDLDHFKDLNDEYGHLVGDDVLEVVGEALEESTRSADLAGRYGGEEFVVVMPRTELDRAEEVAERLLESVRSLSVQADGGEEVGVTCSIGAASLEAFDENGADLLERADRALYRAKGRGRDRVASAG